MTWKIKRAYVRTYSDSGQVTAYVDWTNGSRTEGRVCSRAGDPPQEPAGEHMRALFAAALRQGLSVEHETW